LGAGRGALFRERPEHFAEEEAARGILCRRAIVTCSEREGCGVLLAASVDGVLRAERVGLGSRGGAGRGECGESVESFCQRGRSA
jgi:hypothetical protein